MRVSRLLPTAARTVSFAWAAACVILCVTSAAAQTAASAGTGVTFETFRFGDDAAIDLASVDLLTVPFTGGAWLGRDLSLGVSGAWARATLARPAAPDVSIEGFTDTQLALTYAPVRDAVTLTAIAQLPTGLDRITFDEADVASVIAADVLPFRISNWGTGGGLGASAAVTRPFGAFAAGASIGYVVAHEYEPLSDVQFRYRPGNQLHVRAALDRTFGASGKGSLAVSYQHFGENRADGANLFRSGDRLQGTASWAFALGATGSGIAYAGYLHRDRGEYFDEPAFVVSQGLLFLGAGARLPLGGAVLQPSIDVRVMSGEDGVGGGYTTGVGGAAELPAGTLLFTPTLRARFGHVELADGSDSGFTGAELGLTIRFGRYER